MSDTTPDENKVAEGTTETPVNSPDETTNVGDGQVGTQPGAPGVFPPPAAGSNVVPKDGTEDNA